jgi:hypothetical protein
MRDTDILPQGCLAMCYLTHTPQGYVATLYIAFEVDEEATQDIPSVPLSLLSIRGEALFLSIRGCIISEKSYQKENI